MPMTLGFVATPHIYGVDPIVYARVSDIGEPFVDTIGSQIRINSYY